MSQFILRQLEDKDIELFKNWLYRPHVALWYEHPLSWISEVEARHTGFSFIHHYIAENNEEPIGFCQYYEYAYSHENWHGDIKIEGTYSVDYMIGEEKVLGKGFGKQIVKALINEIKMIPEAKRIIVQPDSKNNASCCTLLSCGFIFDEKNEVYLMNL